MPMSAAARPETSTQSRDGGSRGATAHQPGALAQHVRPWRKVTNVWLAIARRNPRLLLAEPSDEIGRLVILDRDLWARWVQCGAHGLGSLVPDLTPPQRKGPSVMRTGAKVG